MKYWIDGEWNEYRGALISMALVDEDGEEWYEVLNCHSPSPWVAQHVMPFLHKAPTSLELMRLSLMKFLARSPHATIIADWPEDIERLCALIVTGPGLCLRLPTLTCIIDWRLDSAASEIPHQALADAHAMRAMSLLLNPTQ
jgi:hypothetical protein